MVRKERAITKHALRLAVEKGTVPPGAAYFPQELGGGLIVERRTKITGECLKDFQ